MLFTSRESIPESLELLMEDSGVKELCKNYYKESTPQFLNIGDFLKWCGIGKEEN